MEWRAKREGEREGAIRVHVYVPNLGIDGKWALRKMFVFELTLWAFMCMS